jgi:hypothetical protein
LVAGKRPEDAVQATLSSLPDEVIDSVGEKADPGEEALAERRRKLEFLQAEEELIKVAFTAIVLRTFNAKVCLLEPVFVNQLLLQC